MMHIKKWKQFCLCSPEPAWFPADAEPLSEPFAPLVFLVKRDPFVSRGITAVDTPAQLREAEGTQTLLPCLEENPQDMTQQLENLVNEHGATMLNTAFTRCFAVLDAWSSGKTEDFRINLVGLGDVGGTVLTGLKLLGTEVKEISVFDPNRQQCMRYEMELNQILPPHAGGRLADITICEEEDLFRCDLFAFTASRGVPAVGSGIKDVRMAQFEANRNMLDVYAEKARQAEFTGIFCQISDPVDHLSREVFLRSNRDASGYYDFAGLLPEQVQGFGLGVMAARSAYYARRMGIDFSGGRVYGPHGAGLIAATGVGDDYLDEPSRKLTELARTANLEVRDLGFKPYIAPGLSSAAISLLQLLRGEDHYGAIPMGGVYFGCVSRFTPQGLRVRREKICTPLLERIEETYRILREFDYR